MKIVNHGDPLPDADLVAIRREVLRDLRERVAAINPTSNVLALIDAVEARWKREGKLDPRPPDVEDGTVN